MNNQLNQEQQSRYPPQLQITLNFKQEPEWVDQLPPISKHKKKKESPINSTRNQSPKFSAPLEQLHRQLQLSKKKFKKDQSNNIKQQIDRLQHKVFVAETNHTEKEYLNQLYNQTNPNKYLKRQINETVHDAQLQVQKDINFKLQKRKAPRSKEELHQLQKIDHYRYLQIKQGEVKNKVGNLREQLQAEYLRNKIQQKLNVEDIVQKNYFSIQHPRTKEAESFVKNMQERRKQQKKYYQSIRASKREEQQYQKLKDAEVRQIQQQEKRTKLHEFYQNKLQQRLDEKQQQNIKKEQFKEWIKQYQRQKPLQLQKEEQFRMKVLIPQLEERQKKLMTIRAEHKPIDNDQILQHESKYLDFKKDDQIRKKAELQMIDEQNNMRGQDLAQRLYKGKYRYLILEQILEEKYPIDGRQIEQSKRDRIRAYNEHIRQYHKQLKQQKQNQKIEGETIANKKFMRRVRNMNGSLTVSNRNSVSGGEKDKDINSQRNDRKHSEDFNAKKQGNQNLAFLKSMIREQVAKQQQNKPVIHFVQEKEVEKQKGFLEIQRQKRKYQNMEEPNRSKDIPETDVTANEEINAVKSKAQLIDLRLKRKEIKLKNNRSEQDIFQTGKEAQKDYVQAIKTKIQILNQFD